MVLDAKEANKIAHLSKKMIHVYEQIRKKAEIGEFSVNLNLGQDQKDVLESLGYSIKDEVDCDSDYRGSWVGWNR